jgi:hypothetical protein
MMQPGITIRVPSAWDERFASSAEYGVVHVPTKATVEVVRSSPSSKTAGERDAAGSLEHVVLHLGRAFEPWL